MSFVGFSVFTLNSVMYSRVFIGIFQTSGSKNSGVHASARDFGGSGCSITYSTSLNGKPRSFAVYSGVAALTLCYLSIISRWLFVALMIPP